jgi:hypothetical protein
MLKKLLQDYHHVQLLEFLFYEIILIEFQKEWYNLAHLLPVVDLALHF